MLWPVFLLAHDIYIHYMNLIAVHLHLYHLHLYTSIYTHLPTSTSAILTRCLGAELRLWGFWARLHQQSETGESGLGSFGSSFTVIWYANSMWQRSESCEPVIWYAQCREKMTVIDSRRFSKMTCTICAMKKLQVERYRYDWPQLCAPRAPFLWGMMAQFI